MNRPQPNRYLLIADANPENIAVLKTMLAPDYDIKVVANGVETIRLASSGDPPGLILQNTTMATSGEFRRTEAEEPQYDGTTAPGVCRCRRTDFAPAVLSLSIDGPMRRGHVYMVENAVIEPGGSGLPRTIR